jgi:L-ascorbate metabolism protein UlaG (beta-lactamase superfamily)
LSQKHFAQSGHFALVSAMANTGSTQLTWYGQSAFKIVTPGGKVLLLDPWINNPANENAKEHLAQLEKVDFILLTHGHGDHVGETVEIAKRTRAKLVTTHDLGNALVKFLGYPADLAPPETIGYFGGEITLSDGEGTKVLFVTAHHGSGVEADNKSGPQYGGSAGGFVISIENGPAIYHTGDTDVFGDMALIPQFHKIDVMLACIGDHFTMGPERAAYAVKLVQPAMVVPMHFATFPVLTGTPEAFESALKAQGVKSELRVMEVGETISLPSS